MLSVGVPFERVDVGELRMDGKMIARSNHARDDVGIASHFAITDLIRKITHQSLEFFVRSWMRLGL